MIKLFGVILISAGFFMPAFAQDSLQATIVVVGDAGALTNGRHPVVAAVKKTIPINQKTTILFVGDNLYKTGLPDNALPTYDIAKAPLDSQLNIAEGTQAKVYFTPGNHDWANGGKNGFESILRVQSYIDFLKKENEEAQVQMYPRDGCPGPVEVKITEDIVLIIMDSQWWLHENDKPGIESDCSYKTKAEILTKLEDIISMNANKLILFAMHHPFKSNGPHGGYFTLKQHLFPFTDAMPSFYLPLPILGSFYPLTRAVFGTTEDLKHPLYQAMINAISPIIKNHPNIIQLAGHEHNLQLFKDSGMYQVVSGSGVNRSRVSKSRSALFVSPENGFATLQVSKNKTVRISFYEVFGDSVSRAYDSTLIDFSNLVALEKDTLREVEFAFKDSVVISASDKYKHYSGFKKKFLGKNYREEWSTPVTLKVFNLRKEKGGFEIISLGGGKQTKSLRLKELKGDKEWTLRSVDKDPEKALPSNLRGTMAQTIVEDMISASHPFAPLSIPVLAKAAGVATPNPQFYFVPDDPKFGQYRKVFANTVCLLEERDPVPGGEKNTKSTDKVMNKLLADNNDHIDQEKVLNARLLDMMIGDFDRHAGQWKWGTEDTGKGKLYYPVPKDRDQAYFNSDGILLKFLSRAQMPFLQGFKKTIPDVNGLNFVARDFDRIFLNNLDAAAWKKIATQFQANMSDEVIKKASEQFPGPINALNSKIIEEKLKARRDIIVDRAMHYYKFLAKEVTVIGSNEAEYFHLKNHIDGMQLTVYKKTNTTDSSSIMYNRVFTRKETKQLILYGFNGDDKFEIDPDVKNTIKLRIIGGKGNDTFDLKGNIHNFVYDLSTEKNALVNLKMTNREFYPDASVIEYKSAGFQYNKLSFPQLNIGSNSDDGLLVGAGFTKRTYSFRKDPFSTSQKLTSLYALSKKAYQVKYQLILNKFFFKNDLLLHTEIVNPTLDNFFGLGNQTVRDETKNSDFYKVRYKEFQIDLLARKRYNDMFSLSLGPAYYRYWNDQIDNKGKILETPGNIGLDSLSIYSSKQYLGIKTKAEINYINNETFPSRGITWVTEYSNLRGMNKNSNGITKLSSDLAIYASIQDPSKVTGVIKAGVGKIYSKNYEYFQALNLGTNNFLRGYRKNRFSGDGLAYLSGELRVKVYKSNSYILPGDLGILGFTDLGRVWKRGEDSRKWHAAYGGGLYFVPYNLVMISATVAFSPEDYLFNFSLGTKFNLTF